MAGGDGTLTKASAPSIAAATRDAITVIDVGPEHQKYNVHKALLTHHSEYFRKALEGPWKEAQEGVVLLHDVDFKTFELFVHWLYTQRIPQEEEDWGQVLDSEWFAGKIYSKELFDIFIKAYVLGDRLIAPQFRFAVNNSFVKTIPNFYFWNTECQTLSYAFENIPANRVILQRLVDDYCQCWDMGWDMRVTTAEVQKELPVRFLLRIMRKYKEIASSNHGSSNIDEERVERCYYEHVTGDEEQACAREHMVYDEDEDYGRFE